MLSAYKVLVLDDHAFQCAHLKDMLEEAGFGQVDTLQSAGDALRGIRDEGYNLVVMDVNMPVMDGMNFLKQLRRERGGQRPVVVFCTADNDLDTIVEALDAGAAEYIMKPFDSDILVSKFAEAGFA